ncbi:MAG: hypothetical protein IKL68_00945 [Clostridia bacterium]|nr:hypothetical protein [Clostridia bacterium]
MQGTFDRNFINIQVKYPNQDIVFPEDMETIMNQVMYKDQLLRLARVTLQGFDNVIKGAEKYFVIEYSLELAAEYLNNIGINVDTLNKATKLERVVEIYDEAQEEPVAVICKLKKEQHTYEFALDSIKGV